MILPTLLLLFTAINSYGEATDLTRTAGTKGKDVVEAVVYLIRKSSIFPADYEFLRRVAYVESKFGEDANTYRSGFYGGIWQLNETAFSETKNVASHSVLSSIYANITRELDINWSAVQWTDLTKPLYSGIAARLYLHITAAVIPGTVSEQATYWKQYYNKNASLSSDKYRTEVATLESTTECSGLMDLVIVLDGSGSIGDSDFQLAREFVANFTETFALDRVRVAFLVFSATTTIIFPLDNGLTHQQMKARILNATYPSQGTQTNTAILDAIKVFKNATPRDGVPQIMIVYTDGGSDDGVTGALAEVAKTSIISYTVGIGSDINQTELIQIAGNADRVLTLKGFSALNDFIYQSNAEACSQRQKPAVNATTTDGVNNGEKRYFEYAVPAEGITVVLKNSSGQVVAYYSFTNEKPSSALNDGVIDGVTFIPRTNQNGTVLFVSIEGTTQLANNYTIETTHGNVNAQTSGESQCAGKIGVCDLTLNVSPCVCNGNNSIRCDSTNNYQLKQVFTTVNTQLSASAFSLFNSLTVSNYNDASLPVDTFGQLLFKTIAISNSKITSVNKGAFVDTVLAIEDFSLSNSLLANNGSSERDIYEAVSKMPHLKRLDLSNNRLVSVPITAFNPILAQQINLKSISLRSNRITTVGDRAFYELSNLNYIDLSNNTIRDVGPQAFYFERQSSAVLQLNLSHNLLEVSHLDANWYEKTERPLILDLSYNKIHSLTADVFKVFLNRLPQNKLFVSNNIINCDCTAKWLLEDPTYYSDKVIGAVCDEDDRPLFEWTVAELGHC